MPGSSLTVDASDSSRPTHDGVGREHVSEIQRARMLRAMVEESSRLGVANVTVADIVGRSGVSRRTFYEIFEDREGCFLAALDDGIERASQEVITAYERSRLWRERIRRALFALLSFLDDQPGLARVLIVESLGAGPAALECRLLVVGWMTAAVDGGREEAAGAVEPTPLTAEGVVGSVLAVLHGRLVGGDSTRLVDLANPLMAMIVLPYLGRRAARAELERTQPVPRGPRPKASVDPLRDLEMRLTYRTVRVLAAVGANPGSSNRAVGSGAGISDQGQISKLLARLQGLGLIENVGAGRRQGSPNAWMLTQRGWEVHGAIAHDTAA